MFNDAVGFKKIFLKVGYTDLRKGIPILMRKMSFSYSVDVRLTGSKDLFLKEMDSALSINGFPQTVVFNGPVPRMSLRRSLHSSLNGSWRD